MTAQTRPTRDDSPRLPHLGTCPQRAQITDINGYVWLPYMLLPEGTTLVEQRSGGRSGSHRESEESDRVIAVLPTEIGHLLRDIARQWQEQGWTSVDLVAGESVGMLLMRRVDGEFQLSGTITATRTSANDWSLVATARGRRQ